MIDSTQRDITITTPSDLEIVMTRSFAAPAEILFDMWTRSEHVRQWYGVRGTTVTVCDIDLRVGGKWRWVVTKPNGMEIAFSGEFREIDPPHRFQRTEVFESIPGPGSIVTVSFEEKNGQTATIAHMLFATKMDRDMCLKSGMELGVNECYENIDRLVAALTARH